MGVARCSDDPDSCSPPTQSDHRTTVAGMSAEPSSEAKPESGPWDDKTRRKFESKSKSEFYDPCQEAAQASYRCLFRNGGDKTMCGEYFQAYRDCKQAWVERRRMDSAPWLFQRKETKPEPKE